MKLIKHHSLQYRQFSHDSAERTLCEREAHTDATIEAIESK